MLARLVAQSKSRPDVSFGRALFVAAIIGFWMFAVSARLVYLQVTQHDRLANRARQQQQNAIETSAQRGDVLDRQERELARSVQTVSLFVDPEGLKPDELDCTVNELANSLGLNRQELATQLQNAQNEKRRFIWIARRLDADKAAPIVALKLPGVESIQEPKRYYPNGSLAAHLLGFVGLDGKGLGGIEQSQNEKITGEAGQLFIERDASGRSRPRPGPPRAPTARPQHWR
jgi:cell division protein FtsI/penicillin-binding protein 2